LIEIKTIDVGALAGDQVRIRRLSLSPDIKRLAESRLACTACGIFGP